MVLGLLKLTCINDVEVNSLFPDQSRHTLFDQKDLIHVIGNNDHHADHAVNRSQFCAVAPTISSAFWYFANGMKWPSYIVRFVRKAVLNMTGDPRLFQ